MVAKQRQRMRAGDGWNGASGQKLLKFMDEKYCRTTALFQDAIPKLSFITFDARRSSLCCYGL